MYEKNEHIFKALFKIIKNIKTNLHTKKKVFLILNQLTPSMILLNYVYAYVFMLCVYVLCFDEW